MFRYVLVFCFCGALSGAGCHKVFPFSDAPPAAAGRDASGGDASRGDGALGDIHTGEGLPAFELRVTRQPTVGYMGLPLYPPPTIELINAGASSQSRVTLSLKSGTGELAGPTDVAAVDGKAIFEGVSYSKIEEEEEVTLVAESGGASVVLDPFSVLDLPPGACETNDNLFTTALGGCHDILAGLTWSAFQATATWHDAVWDAATTGISPDEHDFGRTNDYPETETPCELACDASPIALCHSLDEGGRQDWRLPTKAELTRLHEHMGTGLYVQRNGEVWTSESNAGSSTGYLFSLEDGTVSLLSKALGGKIICVRGGRTHLAQVRILSTPFTAGNGTQPSVPIIAALTDAAGHQVNAEGLTLRLSSGSNSQLSGTVIAKTDVRGRATLDDWILTTAATLQQAQLKLELEATPPIQPSSWPLTVGEFRHTCQPLSSSFTSAEGGCQHKLSGLVYSAPALDELSWHMAVWDSESPVGNVQPDPSDDERTHDYPPDSIPDSAAARDQSLLNYCHELEESGYSDWRLPTLDDLNLAQGAGAFSSFGFPSAARFWSSNIAIGSTVYAYTGWLGEEPTSTGSAENKKFLFKVLCVRIP